MFSYGPRHVLSSHFRQRIVACLAAILLGILFPGEKSCPAQDGNEREYFQTLPDQSFAVIERKPDGSVVRLLPHHNEKGIVLIPLLEESMNRILELTITATKVLITNGSS